MTRRDFLGCAAASGLMLASAGCPEPPKPGKSMTIDDVCSLAKEGDNLVRASVEGYIDTQRTMFTMCSDTCGMSLRKAMGDEDGLRVNLKVGSGDNRMEKLPEKFEASDLKIHTNEGKVVAAGAKVRVTGQVLGSAKECQLYAVDLIEGR